MRLVDDRLVERGLELLDRTAAVVDPDLDECNALRGELLHVAPPVLLARHPVGRRPQRRRPGPGVRPRQPAPGREEAGAAERTRLLVLPDVAPRVAGVRTQRDDYAHPVVRVAVQVVDDVLAGIVRGVVGQPPDVSVQVHQRRHDVSVQVHQRRHDGLAAQVDDGCSGRHLDLGLRSDRGDGAVVDDQARRLDLGRSRTVDECGAVVHDRGARRRRRFRRITRTTCRRSCARDGGGQGDAAGRAAHGSMISKVHRSSLDYRWTRQERRLPRSGGVRPPRGEDAEAQQTAESVDDFPTTHGSSPSERAVASQRHAHQ